MEGLSITRNNFSNMRSAYGISVKEIAEKSGLSDATIRKFESSDSSYMATHAYECNERLMIRALQELIELKVDGMFTCAKPHLARGPIPAKVTRDQMIKTVKNYCADNRLSLTEFSKMCGVSSKRFSENEAVKRPSVSAVFVQKICKATGWSEDDLINGITEPVKKTEEEKSEEPAPAEKATEVHYNTELRMVNGKYYIEYDIYVPQHVRKEITKEEFIKEVM